ncbi:MAG: sodium/proline symporter [Acidobacteria bacterium]|nr:sodium/proline symporter [Acidobacteriota bacterium]
MFWTIVSFVAFLGAFAVIGIQSVRVAQRTSTDYLLAGQSVNPWLTALSSMATNNSGYAFIGLVGFAYRFGLHTIWLSVAWILGDLLVWLFVHKRVRIHAERVEAKSVPSLLGSTSPSERNPLLIFAAGLLTFVFLGVYAAAQLKAGATALHSLFGWEMVVGILLGAVIVVLYCFSGGLRASIWTDCAQSLVMMVGLAMILVLAMTEIGGPIALIENLRQQDPALALLFPPNLAFGFGLYFLGFVAGGFGAIGAPHILIRSMALKSPAQFQKTRRIYLASFVPFVLASAVIGLCTRALMPELAEPVTQMTVMGTDMDLALTQQAEQSLPLLAMRLLPSVLVGMVLAAIFAATMSTADSQILSCSAAVTQDMMPRWRSSYLASKAATLCVTALATAVAIFAGHGVFSLVLIAWSALAASLGPILLLRLAGQPVPTAVGLTMMVVGLMAVVGWDQSGYQDDVFKLLPGLLLPFSFYLGYRFPNRR